MYFVKKINFNNSNEYTNSTIIGHTSNKIASALLLLEDCAKEQLFHIMGKESVDNFKIIDIHDISQICEPIVDSMLIYRIENDPHTLLFYQRKSIAKEVASYWGWGTSLLPTIEFRKVFNLELEEYESFNKEVKETNTVNIYKYNTSIPKIMQESPMIDLIKELKESKKFIEKYVNLSDNYVINSAEDEIMQDEN